MTRREQQIKEMQEELRLTQTKARRKDLLAMLTIAKRLAKAGR